MKVGRWVRPMHDLHRPRAIKTLMLILLVARYKGGKGHAEACWHSQNSEARQHLATGTWMIFFILQNSNRTLSSLSPHFHFYLTDLEELSAISLLLLTTFNVWQMFLLLEDSVSKKDAGIMENSLLWMCGVCVLLAYVCLTHLCCAYALCQYRIDEIQ